ncbi:hypothetical protein ACTJJ4_05145 [Microbacterium sp. 22195]|uniref:hypothetical protein n=1 Tax=Microbacterium sp. 22195 TaxID=3453891 RepID=UPI003F847459
MKSTMGVPVKTSLAGFSAGNIISDAVFTDTTTMTEAQIQSFFNSKVTTCRGGTDEDGRPIVCIKDFRMNTVNRPADTYCKGYTGAAGESAARIIYRVSQSCGINPQVLIVMLQKEQSLVTHTWPSAWRYDKALGQGCPDGGVACDPKFVGFFHQVYGAARQMQLYMEGRYFKWYAPGNTWNLLWHPPVQVSPGVWKDVCGSSPVYIANKATSALYYYTPYQPNAAALNAGYGFGDSCSSYGNRNFYNYFTDWFGSTQKNPAADNPFGNVEMVQASPGEVAVSGWAIDPNTSSPISVHVYVGGVGTAIAADQTRWDVAGAYPGKGEKHGFSARVPAQGPDATEVCIYAINSGPGVNVLLGCQKIVPMTGSPVGAVTSIKAAGDGFDVTGWAIDPDTTDAATVHVYIGGVGRAFTADAASTAIPTAYQQYGANHGFVAHVPANTGAQTICVYGINIGPGGTSDFGCQQATKPGGIEEKGRAPIGSFETLLTGKGMVTAKGWAIDPDTASPIQVHLYQGGVGRAYTADKARADVATANPGYGDKHGFEEQLTTTDTTTTVCAYAINAGPGGNAFLGCKTVDVDQSIPDQGRAPVGSIASVDVSGTSARVSGWAVDPDTRSPINVHIYVGAAGQAFIADKANNGSLSAFPSYGSYHGFDQTVSIPSGTSTICVYGINTGPGGHSLLGCKQVTNSVAPPVVDRGRAPYGNYEALIGGAGTATVAGWVIDPDTTDPITIHIYVDGVGQPYTADIARPDVAAAYPGTGSNHGFYQTIPMSAGSHGVCVYGINNGTGGHTLLGCRTVTVTG